MYITVEHPSYFILFFIIVFIIIYIILSGVSTSKLFQCYCLISDVNYPNLGCLFLIKYVMHLIDQGNAHLMILIKIITDWSAFPKGMHDMK